jgi:RimJ/RimL family protein N-acetyltransferase
MEIVIGTPSKYSKSKMVSGWPPDELPKGSYFVLLKQDENIIGSLFVKYFKDTYVLRQVEIITEERGKGYGKKMLSAILDFLKPKKRKIILFVDPENKVAVSLYKSLGFKLIQKAAAFGDKYLLTPN